MQNGTAGPYVPVMPVTMLVTEMLERLSAKPDLIAGIVAHTNVTRPDSYSGEATCPNARFSLDGSCSAKEPWNPLGTGALLRDWPFPIFLVRDEDQLKKMTSCFAKFNDFDYPSQSLRALCALELDSFMLAAVDSITCLRRAKTWTAFTTPHYCDPLGDSSVWSTLFPWDVANETKEAAKPPKVVLIVARLDSTSLFNEVTPGAESAVTGLVTLLLLARRMGRLVEETKNADTNVVFALLNGESYDYIGSQRLVWDIKKGRFPTLPLEPLRMEDIEVVIELGQLAIASSLYAHHYNLTDNPNTNAGEKFIKDLKTAASNSLLSVKEVTASQRFPPASIQTFLRERPAIPSVLLTDHDGQKFKNPYYESLYDDSIHLNYTYANLSGIEDNANAYPDDSIQRRIANVVNVTSRALLKFIGVESSLTLDSDEAFYADELLNCYLTTASCRLFKAASLRHRLDDRPLSTYVGVVNAPNLHRELTSYVFAWLTGENVNKTESKCVYNRSEPLYSYRWMLSSLDEQLNATGACFRSTVNHTSAVSPAFEMEDEASWRDAPYSTWTESVWSDLTVRMFLRPSTRHELVTVSIGTVTLVLSMALVYFVNSRSHLLFPRTDSVAASTAAASGTAASC